MTTTNNKSQARTRYEKSHPHIAMRLPTALKDEWETLLHETGMSKVEFITWSVLAFKRQQSERPHNNQYFLMGEQVMTFFKLCEEGDQDALRVITIFEELSRSEAVRKLLSRF